ncbi:RNA 2'-phosphotransferase [Shigella flexneri]
MSSDTNRGDWYRTYCEGWADIDKLILCAQKAGKRLTRALLDTVVNSDKKRFSYSSDGRCICGESSGAFDFAGRYFLCRKHRQQLLYHGTVKRLHDQIKKQGLIAGDPHLRASRADEATARKVGARHGLPVT